MSKQPAKYTTRSIEPGRRAIFRNGVRVGEARNLSNGESMVWIATRDGNDSWSTTADLLRMLVADITFADCLAPLT